MCDRNAAVLIPAYRPDDALLDTVIDLRETGFDRIVIIDDGSGEEYSALFESLKAHATVLTHKYARGGGSAIKTGLIHMISSAEPVPVIITDSNAAHTVGDIVTIDASLGENPNSLVLGSRSRRHFPISNRMGNTFTRLLVGATTGLWTSDTQTRLRGIPESALERFAHLDGNRHDYYLNMLIDAKSAGLNVREIEAEPPPNETFQPFPLRDSLRIYAMLLRQLRNYIGSSIIAGIVDYSMFFIIRLLFPDHLIAAVAGARAISSTVNYIINRKLVFRKRYTGRSLIMYYGVVAIIAGLNWLIIEGFTRLGMSTLISKPIADAALFAIGYRLQTKLVFSDSRKQKDKNKARTEMN